MSKSRIYEWLVPPRDNHYTVARLAKYPMPELESWLFSQVCVCAGVGAWYMPLSILGKAWLHFGYSTAQTCIDMVHVAAIYMACDMVPYNFPFDIAYVYAMHAG